MLGLGFIFSAYIGIRDLYKVKIVWLIFNVSLL